ncbi:hypothetical protein FHP25_35985 [Vineibacter terrae]|uniref:TetR/AcrR family transcriptional regulator n=1 Tax=Vineibacter terrae TaxID=2586908 RepID=A0A5C8PAR3_9HYPH|nr:hypothetical protein [Vineibacter terrae]TXL70125.1 hypothetical protein FHP25_35985 [Vineibacter terrae]
MTDQVEGVEAATETTPAKIDGRMRRAERTRVRILEATRRMIVDGVLRPKAEDIARKADCSTRSIFQHFADLAALYAEALTPALREYIARRLRAMDDADLVAAVQGARLHLSLTGDDAWTPPDA